MSGVTLRECPAEPVFVQGVGNEVSDCTFESSDHSVVLIGDGHRALRNHINGSAGTGIWSSASNAEIIDNRIEGTVIGVFLTSTASSALILRNEFFGNYRAIGTDAPADASIWQNTIYGSTQGFLINGATGLDVRNNIIAGSSSVGMQVSSGSFAKFDSNLFWSNSSNNCSGCTAGPTNLFVDPLFVALASNDFRLSPGSPAIDAGENLGYSFNGAAPDLGALESN